MEVPKIKSTLPSYGMLMLISCTVAFGCYFASNMQLPVVPLYAKSLGINTAQIGLVFFAQGLTNALSRIPMGYLSDKVADRKILVVFGIIGFIIAMGGYNTYIYFGMMLSSVLMGSLVQIIGFDNGFYLTAVVNIPSIAIFYLFMRDFSPIKKEPVR